MGNRQGEVSPRAAPWTESWWIGGSHVDQGAGLDPPDIELQQQARWYLWLSRGNVPEGLPINSSKTLGEDNHHYSLHWQEDIQKHKKQKC